MINGRSAPDVAAAHMKCVELAESEGTLFEYGTNFVSHGSAA